MRDLSSSVADRGVELGRVIYAICAIAAIIFIIRYGQMLPAWFGGQTATHVATAGIPRSVVFHVFDDGLSGPYGGKIHYAGAWEHTAHLYDGRTEGTSSRSYRIGSRAWFSYTGQRFEIFGVRGPTGGQAELVVDGKPLTVLSFYAARKETDVRVFSSPVMPTASHVVEVVVAAPMPEHPKRRFVNLDEVTYE